LGLFATIADGIKYLKFVFFGLIWFAMVIFWAKTTVKNGIFGTWLTNLHGLFYVIMIFPFTFLVAVLFWNHKLSQTKDYIHIIGPGTDLWAENRAGSSAGRADNQSMVLRLLDKPVTYKNTNILKSYIDPEDIEDDPDEKISTVKIDLRHRLYFDKNLWVLKGPVKLSINPEFTYESTLDNYFTERELLNLYEENQKQKEELIIKNEWLEQSAYAMQKAGVILPTAIDDLTKGISHYRDQTALAFRGKERALEYKKVEFTRSGYDKQKYKKLQNKTFQKKREYDEAMEQLNQVKPDEEE